MQLIIGLGNPGLKYRHTRHNVGFMFVDEIANHYKGRWVLQKAMKLESCELEIGGVKTLLIKPLTYMNASGEAVQAIVSFYKIPLEDIIVIYDDLDLDVGSYKIKPSGSSGGHKGMKSIIDHLNTQDIKRIRIGISRVDKDETIDYVLGKFSKDEKVKIDALKIACLQWVYDYTHTTFDELMNKYNKKNGS